LAEPVRVANHRAVELQDLDRGAEFPFKSRSQVPRSI
jgi:hypothetical protein